MLECLILGDSIGVGVSYFKKECVSYVKSGINSTNYIKTYTDVNKKTKSVIISLGTNDTDAVDTYDSLLKLRKSVDAERVVWIVPSKTIKPKQNLIVKRLANEFKDSTLEIADNDLSKDKIHPTGNGYKNISSNVK